MQYFSDLGGIWSAWDAWGACSASCSGGSKIRTRNFSGGQPCNGNSTDSQICTGEFLINVSWFTWAKISLVHVSENEPLCHNPILCISYEECHNNCSSNVHYNGKNALTDEVPESIGNFWLGAENVFPQKIRISFSCPKMISSVKIRNSIRNVKWNTSTFRIKVREPNSTQWKSFTSGILPNPYGQNPVPLEEYTGTGITASEVEFSCTNAYRNGALTKSCALNYIGFV